MQLIEATAQVGFCVGLVVGLVVGFEVVGFTVGFRVVGFEVGFKVDGLLVGFTVGFVVGFSVLSPHIRVSRLHCRPGKATSIEPKIRKLQKHFETE